MRLQSSRYHAAIVIILLIAAAIRLIGLHQLSPPGLSHDEVANWLIDRSILDAGNYAIYYTAAYGHEAAFHYLQALFVGLLGDHALALRLPAAFLGLLMVAINFTLTRRLFGLKVALLAAAWLAILFWPVFYSRQGLRAIMLPVTTGLSVYFWWRGWQRPEGGTRPFLRSARFDFLLAGLFAGLSAHTYMAARAVPVFFLLFIIYLALFHRERWRQKWHQVMLFGLVYVVVAAPLVLYLLTHPGAEYRISEVDAPLRALMAGNLRPVWENSLKIIGMFGFRGDPLWRQNIAGRPVFTPILAGLFYMGVGLSLWRYRDSRYAFLLLWLSTATIPSMVTIDAPSSIRISNSLVVLTIFPALVIHSLIDLSTVFAKLSTVFHRKWTIWILLFLFLLDIVVVIHGIFRVWPANEEVQFVHQRALTETAAYLNRQAADNAIAIAGWTPESMDPSTMLLNLQDDGRPLRYFNPERTLVIPANNGTGVSQIFRPTVLPLAKPLAEQLLAWGATEREEDSFTRYTLSDPSAVRPPIGAAAIFDGELELLGYAGASSCQSAIVAEEDGQCELISYWRVLATPDGPRRLFLHVVDAAGTIVAQDDGLGAPARYWQPGDLVLQQHTVEVPVRGSFTLRLGVYQPPVGPRLLTAAGQDFVLLFAVDN